MRALSGGWMTGALLVALAWGSALLGPAGAQIWVTGADLLESRVGHTATQLLNGNVMVAGGYDAGFGGDGYRDTAEIYDVATGEWALTGRLNVEREVHTATRLLDGKVLLAGGANGPYLASAELYDPATGTWTLTGSMDMARYDHIAVLLLDGTVLVVTGSGRATDPTGTTAEVYNPSTGAWTRTANLNYAHSSSHTATRLLDGNVLVTGGYPVLDRPSVEIYNWTTGVWSTTTRLLSVRFEHTATLLSNGHVLVAGGRNEVGEYLKSCELYNPSTAVWTRTGDLSVFRGLHYASVLLNGNVLVSGGVTFVPVNLLYVTNVYDIATGVWAESASLTNARTGTSVTELLNGNILIVGGNGEAGTLNSTEIYRCLPGFFGMSCQPCNCTSGGTCVDGFPGNGTCSCFTGYDGPRCEVSRCDLVGCNGSGTCQPSGLCLCDVGWTGDFCSERLLCPAEPCQNGECLLDGSCACPFGYEGLACQNLSVIYQLIPTFVTAGGLVVSFAFYWLCLCLYPEAQNGVVFVVMFGILDVATDLMFASTLYNSGEVLTASLFWWSIAFIALPMVLNFALGVYFLLSVAGTSKTDWYRHHYGTVAMVSMLGLTDVESLELLSSRLFYWEIFNANWPDSAAARLVYLGMAPIFFEDLPQMVIQALVLSVSFNSAAVVSMVMSVISIVQALLARLFLARSQAYREMTFPSSANAVSVLEVPYKLLVSETTMLDSETTIINH